MAAFRMDPQYEQWLREEVIYLHSLWRQGPPGGAAASAHVARHPLQPHKATHFKKKNKRGGKFGEKSSNSSPGAEWPCPTTPPPPLSTTGWPTLEPKSNPKPLPLSPEEQSKLAGKHAHQHALKVVSEFFRSNNADDSAVMDSSSDEDDDELMEEDYGREEYSFFFKVFKEDTKLREYYEKNFAEGEFNCLVCGALGGKKMGKKFKGCLALVQHSITIAKTKKMRAHRAFGQAVCKVLGWSIDKLPSIVSLLSDKSGKTEGNGNNDIKETSVALVNDVENVKDGTLEGRTDEAVPETGIPPNGVNSLTSPDACKNLENLGMVHTHNMEKPASDRSTINAIVCPDADKELENLSVVYQQSTEESASQALTINSLTCPYVDKNLENLGMVSQHSVEDSAPQVLTINSLTSPNADNNENLGIVYHRNVEQHAPEGSAFNSSTCVDAVGNSENLGLVHPHNVEVPVTNVILRPQKYQIRGHHLEWCRISAYKSLQELQKPEVSLDENIRVGNEMQDPQSG